MNGYQSGEASAAAFVVSLVCPLPFAFITWISEFNRPSRLVEKWRKWLMSRIGAYRRRSAKS